MTFADRLGIGAILVWLGLAAMMVAGWLTNIYWLIKTLLGDYELDGQVVLSILGLFVMPLGGFHGIYLWFT